MSDPDLKKYERFRARKSTLTLTLLITTASIAVIAEWYFAKKVSYWQWYLAAVISACSAVLVGFYRSIPTWMSGATSLLTIAAALFANTLTNYQVALRGIRFESFNGYKLILFAVAIIVLNPVWMGYFVIAVCATVPLLLYYWVFPAELTAYLNVQDPWINSIYAIVAVFVLRHRLKEIRLERTMTKLQAERHELDNLARIFLVLRDLTNTPLQSIELTSRLLETNNLTAAEGAKYLERSMIRLRELSQVLTAYEKDVDWNKTEASFDAITLLQQKVREKGEGKN